MSTTTDMKNNDFEIGEIKFNLVEASKLSLDDEFMQYNPWKIHEEQFKNLLTKVIQKGVKDFYLPFNGKALFYEEIIKTYSKDYIYRKEYINLLKETKGAERLCVDILYRPLFPYSSFKTGKMGKPITDKTYNWWKDNSRLLGDSIDSRLGTISEYIAFIGTLMKELMSNGWSKEKVWNTVCMDSQKLGDDIISDKLIHNAYSRECYGYYDLNIPKILARDDDDKYDGFWTSGISSLYYNSRLTDLYHPKPKTLTDFYRHSYDEKEHTCFGSIGWIVVTKIDTLHEEE